ncbi:hypothetical protein NKH17_12720 [Mesorhizobium sp. M1334]|uniref:hypothetical protein n=1 Tax=Mesorhizobium sp. M1334 TaxID=2957084 RepID=UPI0033365036
MSADLIERLRADDLLYNRGPNYEPLRVKPSAVRLEAAERIAALEAENARLVKEAEAEADREDKAARDMQTVIQGLRNRATAAESDREALREALRNIAEGNLGDAPWQANYEKIRDVAARAILPRQDDRLSGKGCGE